MDQSDYRKEIDSIDKALTEAFIRRMKVCGELGLYKSAKGLPVYDPLREREKLQEQAAQSPEE